MKRRINSSSIIISIVIIATGFFLMVTFFDFNPEDSLYFTSSLSGEITHFLGKTGARISSFFIYFLGRSAFILAFAVIYSGYVLMRRIPATGKTGYLFLSGAIVTFSMIIFSIQNNDLLYKGGGLFGSFIADKLSPHLNRGLLFTLTLLCLLGGLIVLFKYPAGYFLRIIKQRRTGPSAKIEESCNGDSIKKTKKSQKPPFFRKVYYDSEGDGVRSLPHHESSLLKKIPAVSSKRRLSIDEYGDTGEKETALSGKQSPDLSLLRRSTPINRREREKETARKAKELERTLNEFGIDAKVTGIIRGPVITRYELQPAPGVKLSRIVNLSNNIALSLSANGVRIEAPIPGRAAVGIEIPNDDREIVTLGDVIENAYKEGELPIILGKDISGNIVVADLTKMPHLLIAGATGSGKSVCVNSLIMSLLFQKEPEDVKFIMIDPKMVELKVYNGIAHLLTEVVTDPRDAAKVLRWLLYEMENRYRLLDESYARNISGYNQKAREKLPYIIVIVDEYATLMSISQKEVEDAAVRLAAMSRAVGIHLIMATQRPSVDVITGLIKANFPYRIAFQVASKTDSRTIIDASGAEKLLGRGDMLFVPAGSMNIQRIQGAFISEEEIFSIVNELKKKYTPEYREDILTFEKNEVSDIDYDDPMFDQAVEIVLKTKRASASFLQRRLKIGYNRSARLIELMEEKGIIGPPRGSKPREIYIDRVD